MGDEGQVTRRTDQCVGGGQQPQPQTESTTNASASKSAKCEFPGDPLSCPGVPLTSLYSSGSESPFGEHNSGLWNLGTAFVASVRIVNGVTEPTLEVIGSQRTPNAIARPFLTILDAARPVRGEGYDNVYIRKVPADRIHPAIAAISRADDISSPSRKGLRILRLHDAHGAPNRRPSDTAPIRQALSASMNSASRTRSIR